MYFIFGRDYRSCLIENLDMNIATISFEELQAYPLLTFFPEKVYAAHEEAVEAVKAKLPEGVIKEGISLFRNKWKMRIKLAKLFPNYYFKKVDLLKIVNLKLLFDDPCKKYVIKPIKGFFS